MVVFFEEKSTDFIITKEYIDVEIISQDCKTKCK